ncbi:MAG TPA: ImmA/IrrE family metallo-endopeptidase [Candidatus Elarobacter sp.]|nr:ImmA/IrrE family metallo-endopeptidase [Candidatus Elarobacter sp.]
MSAPQDVRALAAAYGIGIAIADLGDWGTARLIAEYDPDGPAIRVNARELVRIDVERAIAHELYHHREAIGEVPRLRDRDERERAADAFAAELLGAP